MILNNLVEIAVDHAVRLVAFAVEGFWYTFLYTSGVLQPPSCNYSKIKQRTFTKQLLFENPFYQATALINEMINLDYEYVDGKIKVKETGRMRKDRYSALAYGYYVSCLLERELRNSKRPEEYKNAPVCVSNVEF